MRVIAGKFRSRQLSSLKGMAVRPTSDRLRETLFNILGEHVPGSRFVDLFAGTGAVGIEALSRGAAEAIFIERHARAAALIRKNLESLGIKKGGRVLAVDALHGLELLERELLNEPRLPTMVFLDPPYGNTHDYHRVLGFLGLAERLDAKGLVIAEHQKNCDLPEGFGSLERVRVVRQGDACLSFYRLARNGLRTISHLESTPGSRPSSTL